MSEGESKEGAGQVLQALMRQPTPVFMPGKSHGLRSLVGYNPWGRKESDTTERLLCVCVCVYELLKNMGFCSLGDGRPRGPWAE